MEQVPGLCSPGSATLAAFVNVSVAPESSELVTFAAVPMRSGDIPIKIRLYDITRGRETDAVEKNLNVQVNGWMDGCMDGCGVLEYDMGTPEGQIVKISAK